MPDIPDEGYDDASLQGMSGGSEMKVKDLIKLLQGYDGESIVIMSQDEEGNGYSPLANISTCNDVTVYVANNSWSGEVGLAELTDELRDVGYGEDDVLDGVPCIVLWPTN